MSNDRSCFFQFVRLDSRDMMGRYDNHSNFVYPNNDFAGTIPPTPDFDENSCFAGEQSELFQFPETFDVYAFLSFRFHAEHVSNRLCLFKLSMNFLALSEALKNNDWSSITAAFQLFWCKIKSIPMDSKQLQLD